MLAKILVETGCIGLFSVDTGIYVPEK